MKVTFLNENTVYRRGLIAEHGLSMLLTHGTKQYLMDTGQSDVYLRNAAFLKRNISSVDGIILSHGHYDHCGGMTYLPKDCEAPVYIRATGIRQKYSFDKKKQNYVRSGVPFDETLPAHMILLEERCTQIAKDTYLLGNIPYEAGLEEPPVGFYLYEDDHYVPDYMEDEQLLVIREEQGLCIFMGCCHPGMRNALKYVQSFFPDEHMHALVAGMHLIHAGEQQIQCAIEEVMRQDIDCIIPMHCTGPKAIAAFEGALGDRVHAVESGITITI